MSNKEILEKTAKFHEAVFDRINHLRYENDQLQKSAMTKQSEYEYLIRKVADILYQSDFFTDSSSARRFMKEASADVDALVTMVEKITKAAEVSSLGHVTDISSSSKYDDDPIAARLFGSRKNLY